MPPIETELTGSELPSPAPASFSGLQNRHTAELQREPFYQYIIRNALPDALCGRLIASYPALKLLGAYPARNNVRWSFPASEVRKTDAISNEWKAVIDYHVSRQFYDEIIDLFGDAITTLYPGLFPDRESMVRLSIVSRGAEDINSGDIRLDAQISINTPVRTSRSVKPDPIDSHRKHVSGLLYLVRDEDDSTGAIWISGTSSRTYKDCAAWSQSEPSGSWAASTPTRTRGPASRLPLLRLRPYPAYRRSRGLSAKPPCQTPIASRQQVT